MKEIWKDIKGYEGLYQVSNLGKVKSLKKNIILKPYIEKKGYLRIDLNKNGKSKHYLIHRLVAEAFIPNPLNKLQINHIDCNKQNNCINNLEWSTNLENAIHAYNNNLRPFKPLRKINQYDLDGNFIKTWNSIIEASSQFKNVSNHPQCNISGVLRGLRKTAFGYIWKYADK